MDDLRIRNLIRRRLITYRRLSSFSFEFEIRTYYGRKLSMIINTRRGDCHCDCPYASVCKGCYYQKAAYQVLFGLGVYAKKEGEE